LNMDWKKIKLHLVNNLIWVIIVGLFLFFALLIPRGWLGLRNIEFILYVGSMIGFLVIGESLVLLSGNMDLSLAQNAGLSAMIVGYLSAAVFEGAPGWVWIMGVIIVGAILGSVNGFLIGKLRMNAFLATLGTFLAFNYATFLISRGTVVGLPKALILPGSLSFSGFHMAILIFFAVAVLVHFLLRYTRFGANVYSVGGDPEASRKMGINIGNTYFWVFTLAGALAGLSALIFIGYLGCVPSTMADGMIFMAFAGAVMGGISLRGGRGGIIGAIGGVILFGIIEAGLTMINIDPALRGIFSGVVLIVAIMINRMRERIIDKLLMPPQG